jgi:hypothetical protein
VAGEGKGGPVTVAAGSARLSRRGSVAAVKPRHTLRRRTARGWGQRGWGGGQASGPRWAARPLPREPPAAAPGTRQAAPGAQALRLRCVDEHRPWKGTAHSKHARAATEVGSRWCGVFARHGRAGVDLAPELAIAHASSACSCLSSCTWRFRVARAPPEPHDTAGSNATSPPVAIRVTEGCRPRNCARRASTATWTSTIKLKVMPSPCARREAGSAPNATCAPPV